MLIIFLSLASGLFLGFVYKGERLKSYSEAITRIMILLLVGLMGLSLSSNREILHNFFDLGIKASIFAIGSIAGSITAVTILLRLLERGEK
ncbi:MAG: LysO family transporter [Candidatus Pacebacteria bacterium]|nr:LysO family transporter [Candidatus Paceibacterota bacterium]